MAATRASHIWFYPHLLKHIGNMMLARHSADPAMSHSGLVLLGLLQRSGCAVTNTHHRHLHKNSIQYKRNRDTNM